MMENFVGIKPKIVNLVEIKLKHVSFI